MRFGCCGSLREAESIAGAGYDYIELPVHTVVPEDSDDEWIAVRRTITRRPINPEAWNCLMPGHVKITGPDVAWARIKSYLNTAFGRISEVGGRVVVFGSGAARNIPEHFPMEEARAQLRQFLEIAGEAALKRALRLAIEPLNRRECNVINSVPEGIRYASEANHAAVGVLADYYHMQEEQEPVSNILSTRHFLMHVHTADTDRLFPGSGSYDHEALFRTLIEVGYDKRVSCECSWGDDPDTARASALEFLRSTFSRVSSEG